MAKYNPLAEFLGAIMDKYIDDYIKTCQEHNYPVRGEDFKDVLDRAHDDGTLPANICILLNARFQQRTDNNTLILR